MRYHMGLVETNVQIATSESTGYSAWSDVAQEKWDVHNLTSMPAINLEDWPDDRCAL